MITSHCSSFYRLLKIGTCLLHLILFFAIVDYLLQSCRCFQFPLYFEILFMFQSKSHSNFNSLNSKIVWLCFFLFATFGILPPSSPNLFSFLVAFCVSLLLTFTSCSILQMCPHQRHQRGIFVQICRSGHLRADFCPRHTWTRSEAYYQHIFTTYV